MSHIKLTVLGSGTMMPTKERNPSGFLLEANEKRVLLDCGHGTVSRLVDLGIDPQTIDAVFISHFHTDHFGDAFNLVHARFVEDIYQDKHDHKEILFIGPEDIEKRFGLWRQVFWVEPKEHYPIVFKEGVGEYRVGDIRIETFEVKHVQWFQSVGAKITVGNKTIVYTGDIGSDHDFNLLTEQTRDADLLITEASYEQLTPNHFTFPQVVELAEKANIAKVLVVHLRPQMVERTRELVAGNPKFQLAEDKTVITL